MQRVFVLDNYDSFTFNLVHLLEAADAEVTVRRNDAFELEEPALYDAIVLSPGPGLPREAGNMMDLLGRYAESKKILGVCLGHQAIAEHFGGSIFNRDSVKHGTAVRIEIARESDVLFEGLPEQIEVGLYHSWSVAPKLPVSLESIAVDEDGHIMAIRHRELPLRGVQFHPESILTPNGPTILQNWLSL